MTIDSDDDNIIDESLFVDTSYTKQSITFNNTTTIQYYALHNVTTAYDLTGQILWPATQILAQYILHNKQLLQPYDTTIEFGAGIGIISLLIAQCCSNIDNIVISDHNEHVVKLIQQNIQLNNVTDRAHTVKLEWGNNLQIDTILQQYSNNTNTVLFGSDLCYSISAVEALMETISDTLHRLRERQRCKPIFILSYILRTQTVHTALHNAIQQHQLLCNTIELNTFMCNTVDNGYLYILSLT